MTRPEQSVAHGHVHHPARALDFIARVEMPVFAEQDDANFVRVHVERNAEQIAGKHDQFIKTHARESGHLGDAGGDTNDRAHLARRQFRRECFSHLAGFRQTHCRNRSGDSQVPCSLALGCGFRLGFGLRFALLFQKFVDARFPATAR